MLSPRALGWAAVVTIASAAATTFAPIALATSTATSGDPSAAALVALLAGLAGAAAGALGAWRVVGSLGVATGAALALKPVLAPLSTVTYRGTPHEYGLTSETHLWFLVPGVALAFVGAAALVRAQAAAAVTSRDATRGAPAPRPAPVGMLFALCVVAAGVLLLAVLDGRYEPIGPGAHAAALAALALALLAARPPRATERAVRSADASDSAFDALLAQVARAPAVPLGGGGEPADPRVGTRVDQFELEARLGQGGMGVVYRAHDARLSRQVALKLLPPELTGDPLRRARLAREARAAARVHHPCVAAVFDASFDGPVPYIAMELVRGTSLRAVLRRGPLDLAAALTLVRDVADGLAAAHREGVVHRDLKPDNVMVTDGPRAKILDFGLARVDAPVVADAPTSAALTRPWQVMGTPEYMAPEQLAGGVVDARADVFALGATLYEMLVGRRLFAGTSASVEGRRALLATAATEPALRAAGVAPACAAVLARCLAHDPAARYADGGAVAAALRALPSAVVVADGRAT